MSIAAIANRLNEFSIFGGIDAEALAELDDLFEARHYQTGVHLIDEGAKGNRLYIITDGRAEVSKHAGGEDGGELLLAMLHAGETFGEMELIDTQHRSATVIAVEPTDTLELTNMGLLQVFERDADAFRMLMMNLARDLSRRLRAAGDRLVNLAESGVVPPLEARSGG